jgi:hypothetical protein
MQVQVAQTLKTLHHVRYVFSWDCSQGSHVTVAQSDLNLLYSYILSERHKSIIH